MGLVLSAVKKFRKKKSTKEHLVQIEEDITKFESSLTRNRQLQKSVVLTLLITSTIFYLSGVLIFYLWYIPSNWKDRVTRCLPFLVFPVLVFLLKRLLHYIFVTRISRNAKSLEERRKEKTKILENVMETETYKVAKELLEKFDPTRKLVERDTPLKKSTPRIEGQELRQRHSSSQPSTPASILRGTAPPSGAPLSTLHTPRLPSTNTNGNVFASPGNIRPQFGNIRPNIPNAPILPRDRSVVDKIAEYFVGDGPSNRFALICRQCYSHNGMALTEEFEYIAYRCCYCGQVNPPRKQRQQAPPLPQAPMRTPNSSNPPSKLNSEVESETDTEHTDDNDGDSSKVCSTSELVVGSEDEGLGDTCESIHEQNGSSGVVQDKEAENVDQSNDDLLAENINQPNEDLMGDSDEDIDKKKDN